MTRSTDSRAASRSWVIAVAVHAACALASMLWLSRVEACTTFRLISEERTVLGKNYDWYVAPGLLFVNKRGVERSSEPPKDRGKTWVSRYGSVTFNQYGRDLPAGGMNEAGLVVEVLWMNGTLFPEPDHRPAATATAWVQYQLDTPRSVSEVVASDTEVRISRTAVPVHYFVADRDGDVAVIEFRNGERTVYQGATLPTAALANDFYVDAVARSSEAARAGRSGDRFARAGRSIREYSPSQHGDPVAYAFATLAEVAQRSGQGTVAPGFGPPHVTLWSIVYELDAQRVHFRTEAASSIKTLSLAGIDFSCAAPVLMLDLHAPVDGDVRARLRTYSRDANLALIRETFAQTSFLRGLPDKELERVASWPEQGSCLMPALR